MAESLSNYVCFICKSNNHIEKLMDSFENSKLGKENHRSDLYCNHCNLLFKNKKIINSKKEKYWNQVYSNDRLEGIRIKEEKFDKKYNKIISELRKDVSDSEVQNILEVGTFTGSLINKLQDIFPDKNFFGIDPSLDSINYGRHKYQSIKLYDHFFENHESKIKYDLIIFSSVIFRLDIDLLFAKVDELINPDGKIIIVNNFLFDDTLENLKYESLSDVICSNQYLEYHLTKKKFEEFFRNNNFFLEKNIFLDKEGDYQYFLKFSKKNEPEKNEKNNQNFSLEHISKLYLTKNIIEENEFIKEKEIFLIPKNYKKKHSFIIEFLERRCKNKYVLSNNLTLIKYLRKKNIIWTFLEFSFLEIFIIMTCSSNHQILSFINSKKDFYNKLPNFKILKSKIVYLNKLKLMNIRFFRIFFIKKFFKNSGVIYKIYEKIRKL